MASVPSAPVVTPLVRSSPGVLEFWWGPPDTPNGTITNYTLTCTDSGSEPTPGPFTITAPASYYQVSGLTDNQEYAFELTATNDVPLTSAAAQFLPTAPGVPSSSPTGTTAVQVGNTAASVSWTPPATQPNTIDYYMITAQPKEPLVPVYRYSQYGDQTSQTVPNLNFLETGYAFNTRAYSTPGWSDPSANTATIGYPRVYCPYVTNVFAQQSTFVDPSGNTFIFAQAFATTITPATAPQVYDRFGNLRATGQVNTATLATNFYVIYVSADGFTDLWIANLTSTGVAATLSTDTASTTGTTALTPSNTNFTPLGQIDSEGNFVLMFTLNLAAGGTFQAFDRNNISFGQIFSGLPSSPAYIVKYSKSGLGTLQDPNTWIARCSTTVSAGTNPVRVLNFQFDLSGNIVALLAASNANASAAANFQSFSANGIQFGTNIALMIGADYATTTAIVVKYNKLGTGQWNAYAQTQSGNTASFTNPFFGSNFAILPNNNIVYAFRVQRSSGQGVDYRVFGSDNVAIGTTTLGLNVPASGTLSNYTVVVQLSSDGLAATSQRAIIQTATDNAARFTVPVSVVPDASGNFYVVGYSISVVAITTPVDFTLIANTPNTDTVGVSTIVPMNITGNGYRNLIYVVRYNTSCVPQWIGTLRATQSTLTATYISFNGVASPQDAINNPATALPQDLTATVDKSGNIVFSGSYGALGTAVQGSIQTFSTQNLGGSGANTAQKNIFCPPTLGITEVFVAKFLSDGTESYLARIGVDQTGTNANTNPNQLIVDASNNVIISCRWQDVNCGIYNDSSISPAVTLPGLNSSQTNILVARFNPLLQGVSGNVGYIRFATGAGTVAINSFLLALDSQQNVILAGTYTGIGGAAPPANNIEFYNFGNIVTPFATRQNATISGTTSDIYVCKFTIGSQSPWAARISGVATTNGESLGLAQSVTNINTPVSYLRDTPIDRIILMGYTNAANSAPIIYDATDTAIVNFPPGSQAITYLPTYPFNGVSALN